jgi:hypothetical protein
MKAYFLIVVLLCAAFIGIDAHAQNWIWANNMESYEAFNGLGAGYATGAAADHSGNVVIVGEGFITKYNAAGTVLWTKIDNSIKPASVCTDQTDNVLVAGYFGKPFNFDTTTLTNVGQEDVFLAKFDSSGKLIWARQAGGTGRDEARAVSVDGGGNIFLAGIFFSPSIAFGPSTLSSGGCSAFIVKYDASGSVIWANDASSTKTCSANSVVADGNGGIVVVGNFDGNVSFGPSSLTNTAYRSSDFFVARYDTSGNILWAKSGGGDGAIGVAKVSVDSSDNIYVVGNFTGSAIRFGSIALTKTSNTNFDLFIASYQIDGSLRWAKQAGGTGDDMAVSVATDKLGHVFIAGRSSSPGLDFGSETLPIPSPNIGGFKVSNLFLAMYDNSGNERWSLSSDGADEASATDVVPDGSGNLYVLGTFRSPQLRLGNSVLTKNLDFEDVFLAKLEIPTGMASFASAVTVCPNPVGENFCISTALKVSNVKILDLSGRKLLDRNYEADKAPISINLSQLGPGVYQIVVNGRSAASFIKQ